MRRRPIRDPESVSATELAEMGVCEKRVQLAHLHGRRLTISDRQRMELGRIAHLRFHRQALAASPDSDDRCFVATCLFGASAWQTVALRGFRDEVLLPAWWGRVLVEGYYRCAPTACALLRRCPAVQPSARAVVGAFARILRHGTASRDDAS